MKSVICLIFSFIWSAVSLAQHREAANWLFGIKAAVTFKGLTPVPFYTSQMDNIYSLTTASISDSAGSLLFYTDGRNIMTRTNSLMPNGTNFVNDTIGTTTSPRPFIINKGNGIYWVVVGFDYLNTSDRYGLFYVVVDMKLNGGLGDVVASSKYKYLSFRSEKFLALMRHANEKDHWLVSKRGRGDTLIAWPIIGDSIGVPVYSKMNTPIYNTISNPNGGNDFKSSPNSEYLYVSWLSYSFRYDELYKFDRQTGQFHSRIYIRDSLELPQNKARYDWETQASFSPDSKLLYIFENFYCDPPPGPVLDCSVLRQYSLDTWDSAAIEQSKIYLGRFTKPEYEDCHFSSQIGLDGKIYFAADKFMGIIHCPNIKGHGCKVQRKAIGLNRYAGANLSLPNQTFIANANLLKIETNTHALCQGDTLELVTYGAAAEHFSWSATPALPQGIGPDTVWNQKFSTAGFPPGNYTLTCTGRTRCGDVSVASMNLTVWPTPQKAEFITEQKPVVCLGDSVLVKVQNTDTSFRYYWNTGDSAATIKVRQTRLYVVDSVISSRGCMRKEADTVAVSFLQVLVPQVPVLLSPSLVEVCEGQKAELKVRSDGLKVVWSNGQTGDSILVDSGQFTVYSETQEGCRSAGSDTVWVKRYANPKPVFLNLSKDDTLLTLNTLENRNYCVAGLPGSVFSFHVENGTAIDSSEDCITINWLPGNIQRSLNVTETRKEADCRGSSTQTFTYRPNLSVPNLVTPNGDGLNDVFVIQDLEFYASHHLQIFNRWGKKVMDTQDYRQDWTGEAGMYFYRLSLESQKFTGWVEVVE